MKVAIRLNPNDESIDSQPTSCSEQFYYNIRTHEDTITILFLVGTVMRLMMLHVSIWLNTPIVRNMKQFLMQCYELLCFCQLYNCNHADLLELDSWLGMNYPSTIGGNWSWRRQQMNWTLIEAKLYSLTKTYRRLNKNY